MSKARDVHMYYREAASAWLGMYCKVGPTPQPDFGNLGLFYAVSLVSLTPASRRHLKRLHRTAVRAIRGLLQHSPIAATGWSG